MKDITDEDYTQKDFKTQNSDEYHDLSNILLLADVFKHFRNICLEMYELNPARFFLMHLDYYDNQP